MKLVVAAAAVVVLASPGATAVQFLQSRQLDSGVFAERGSAGDTQLTAWAVLGLRAAGASPRADAAKYLAQHEAGVTSATGLALVVLAETALRQRPDRPLARLRALERPSGAIGGLVNGTAWGVLALRAAGAPVRKETIRWLLSKQSPSGGWGWTAAGADSNDTAAVVQALRAVEVRGRPIQRALRFLLHFRNRDGGFELTPGRGSDAQSTAWVIQAFLAAGKALPRGSLSYLRKLQAKDGSIRYSARYATTPVWVTAEVLPALARAPFPLS